MSLIRLLSSLAVVAGWLYGNIIVSTELDVAETAPAGQICPIADTQPGGECSGTSLLQQIPLLTRQDEWVRKPAPLVPDFNMDGTAGDLGDLAKVYEMIAMLGWPQRVTVGQVAVEENLQSLADSSGYDYAWTDDFTPGTIIFHGQMMPLPTVR
jgi:hypothetical protein